MNGALLVVLGGLGAGAVSAVVAYLMVPRIVAQRLPELLTALAERPHHLEEQHVPTDQQPTTSTHRRPPDTKTLLIIALAMLLVVLGVQVRLADRTRDDSLDCLAQYAGQIQDWSTNVNTALTERSNSTKHLRKRTQAWTRRDDAILQLLFRANGGEVLDDGEVNGTIGDYQRAKERLFKAFRSAERTVTENPYPVLKLTCDTDKKEPKP